ncbi:hypothetical protein NUW54_g5447 [Trametes sanguinea]|uniref:Uncharacterized protein n=1 Tax=Trametes sanguinea TaxID=158606 RepID=A0ACC1PWM7_9APHY|nr:hypothetical protein NUW54_g5447 [Trametes sanguinea]
MASGSITWGPVETLETMRERIEKPLCKSSDRASSHSSSRSSPGHVSGGFIYDHRSSSLPAGGEAIDHMVVAGTKRTNIEQGEGLSTEEIAGSKRLRTISQRSTHQDDSLSTPLTNHISSPHQPSPHHQTALAAPAATFSGPQVQTSTSATHAAAPHFAGVPRALAVSAFRRSYPAARLSKPMAPSALAQLDQAYELFTQASQHSRRAAKALPILLRLREKAHQAFQAAQADPTGSSMFDGAQWKSEDGEDELDIFAGRTVVVPSKRKSVFAATVAAARGDTEGISSSSASIPGSQARPSEIDVYFTDVHPCDENGALQWWKDHAAQFPVLALIARDILAIPGVSIAVERLFSSCRHTLRDARSSLSASSASMTVITKEWLKRGLGDNIDYLEQVSIWQQ